jgi:predicted nucleotidyltransferase
MTIEELKDKGLIIFEAVAGSISYGLNTENSDVDIRGVYIAPNSDLLSMKYIDSVKPSMTVGDLLEEAEHNEAVQDFIRDNDSILNELLKHAYKMNTQWQVNDKTNDTVYYELGKFLSLVESNNPNILELLNMPEQFIQYKHPVWDIILEHKDKLLTKRAGHAFNGYANSQIAKARGQNKMITNEKELVKKKDLLDFCYVIARGQSIPLKKWLEDTGRDQIFCGLAKIDHGNIQKVDKEDNTGLVGGLYALYYDQLAHNCFSKRVPKKEREKLKKSRLDNNQKVGYGFKGIVNEDDAENTNEIRVSNIPKSIANSFYVTNIVFNANGYASHRKDYKKYKKLA